MILLLLGKVVSVSFEWFFFLGSCHGARLFYPVKGTSCAGLSQPGFYGTAVYIVTKAQFLQRYSFFCMFPYYSFFFLGVEVVFWGTYSEALVSVLFVSQQPVSDHMVVEM